MDDYHPFSWLEKVPPVYRAGGVFVGLWDSLKMYKT